MITLTVTCVVCPYPSVTVHWATPLRVTPEVRPVAVKLVAAAAGGLMEMPAPPEAQTHAYPYVPEPPLAVTVEAPVVCVPLSCALVCEVGAATAVTSVARLMATAHSTSTLATWPRESLTVHAAVPDTVCPGVRPGAVNVVESAAGELIVIPTPPVCQLHE